ncbi:MAG: transglycosylase family protein, partial [Solirubrobacteraceae bacterium]
DGASGPYQDLPSTWLAHGGGEFAPQAYEATRYQQDLINHRIWVEGGPSQWSCSSLVIWR